MSNEENKLRVSPCSQCLRVFLQNHPKKGQKWPDFPTSKNQKNPFRHPKRAFRHPKRGFRHGCPGKGKMLVYL